MKQKARYSRCGCTGVFQRSLCALSRTVLTRRDSGRTVPNLALVGGYYAGSAIAMNWYPERYRFSGEGVRLATTQLAFISLGNLFTEFAPEVKRLFGPRHKANSIP
ncbi:MAG: hypothetical protein H7039_10830 [Bryobacteraceae bacterium]|nr:hypothetical protein [Bryobacteraceae bacterium]